MRSTQQKGRHGRRHPGPRNPRQGSSDGQEDRRPDRWRQPQAGCCRADAQHRRQRRWSRRRRRRRVRDRTVPQEQDRGQGRDQGIGHHRNRVSPLTSQTWGYQKWYSHYVFAHFLLSL